MNYVITDDGRVVDGTLETERREWTRFKDQNPDRAERIRLSYTERPLLALLLSQPVGSTIPNPFPTFPVRNLVKVEAHYRLPSSARTEADRVGEILARPNHPRVPKALTAA